MNDKIEALTWLAVAVGLAAIPVGWAVFLVITAMKVS